MSWSESWKSRRAARQLEVPSSCGRAGRTRQRRIWVSCTRTVARLSANTLASGSAMLDGARGGGGEAASTRLYDTARLGGG
jgi:hypothetical protein